MMRRRDFITLLGGAAASTWPLTARAQQPAVPVIGWLDSGSPEAVPDRMVVFRKGLAEVGFVEGRNVRIEYRWAEGHYDRLPTLAADLVRQGVTVISALGAPQALAAKATNTTIPIVFQVAADPVELGLVASLNQPGGTVTGVTSLNLQVGPKRLELMHELLPTTTSMALLVNPANATNAEADEKALQAAASALGLHLNVFRASTDHDLDAVFANLAARRVGGLVIGPDTFFLYSKTEQIAALATRHAIPTVMPYREFAVAGGLVSYGGDIAENWRQAGIYTGRVLKGERPGDLPVQQVTKVQLSINLKSAKALGLTVPPALVARADEVIE